MAAAEHGAAACRTRVRVHAARGLVGPARAAGAGNVRAAIAGEHTHESEALSWSLWFSLTDLSVCLSLCLSLSLSLSLSHTHTSRV